MSTVGTELAEGSEVTVVGVVRAIDPLVAAPMTGRACVAHVTCARVWTEAGVNGELVTEVVLRALARFAVDTDRGSVLVATGEFEIVAGAVFIEPSIEDVLALLAPRGVAQLARSTFFEQALVMPGERVEVRGVVTCEPSADLEGDYREIAMQQRLTGYRERPLTIAPA